MTGSLEWRFPNNHGKVVSMRIVKKYMTLFQLGCTLFAWLAITQVSAVPVKKLYDATIPTANQSASTKASALKQAFGHVLVKVSGSSATLQLPNIEKAEQKINDYVLQYRYSKNPQAALDNQPLLLHVNFGNSAINTLLLKSGASIWGSNRPLTLFWIAKQTSSNKQLIGASSSGAILNFIERDAKRRGLPILFPVLDLTDVNNVSPDDVIAPFVNTIQKASQRYGSNAIVIVRFKQNGTQWKSDWTLVTSPQLKSWRFSSNNLETISQEGMDNVVDALAQAFSLNQASMVDNQHPQVIIQGISSLSAYAKAQKYLEQLAPVQKATTQAIQANQVTFSLQLAGNIQALEKTIRLDHVLTPTPNETNLSNVLTYQWTP